MSQEVFTTIIQLALTGGIGIVTFFLKRTMTELDECKKDIAEIKSGYATNQKLDECRRDIAQIKEDYITKEDFFREQTENRRKLDKIMDILLEIKGESK
jgi:antirestriction protein